MPGQKVEDVQSQGFPGCSVGGGVFTLHVS